MSAHTNSNETTAPDDRQTIDCPEFSTTTLEDGVICLQWWVDGLENRAHLRPITTDDHYEIVSAELENERYLYLHGDPYTDDPYVELIDDGLRDVVETMHDITIVDVDTGAPQ